MGIKQLPLVQIECDRIDSEIPPGKIRFERALRHTGVLPWGWIDLLPCTGQVERQAVDHQANRVKSPVNTHLCDPFLPQLLAQDLSQGNRRAFNHHVQIRNLAEWLLIR